MKMKHSILISVNLCFALLISCSKPKTQGNKLNEECLKEALQLTVDTLPSIWDFDEENVRYPRKCYIYQDSVLILNNKRSTNGYFIEFLSMKDGRILKQLYPKGEGPDELLLCTTYFSLCRELQVNDIARGTLGIVAVDSLMADTTLQFPLRNRYAYLSPTAIPYKEGYLVENPNRFIHPELGIVQDAPRFMYLDGVKTEGDTIHYPYDTRNVVADGLLISNPQKNRILYANMHQSKLEVYDWNLKLLREVDGPIELNAEYSIDKYNEITFKGKIPYAYLDYCSSEDYCYLIYMGDCLDEDKDMKDYPSWIFQFDWDGNFVNSYTANCCLRSISLSADQKSFYALSYSFEGEPILVKLTLP
jgi:hypothetical protein